MTHQSNLVPPAKKATAVPRMLVGAAIAFALIALFLYGVDNPNPNWPKYWMLRPLIVVPVVGAMGGLFFHGMQQLHHRYGWHKIVTVLLGIVGYVVAIWMGAVLGLDGTLWN